MRKPGAEADLRQAIEFIDNHLHQTFAPRSLRIRFEPLNGTVLIDRSTVANLELIQNLSNSKSKHCLYGLLNRTRTPMGGRLLKRSILQPSTDGDKLEKRWAAVEELMSNGQLFSAISDGMLTETSS